MTDLTAALQKCFDAKEQFDFSSEGERRARGPRWDPDPDVLGFGRATGILVWRQSGHQTSTVFETTIFDTRVAVEEWLSTPETVSAKGNLALKLLVGNQIRTNDCLRTDDGRAISVSRRKIAASLKVAPLGISKMGTTLPWSTSFPSFDEQGLSRYGTSTACVSANWSYDCNTFCNRAFMIYGSWPMHDRLLHQLETLQSACHLPLFVPFVLTDTCVSSLEKSMVYREEASRESTKHLGRFLYQTDSHDLFFQATSNISQLEYDKATAAVTRKMAQQMMIQDINVSPEISPEVRDLFQNDCDLLKQALKSRVQELNCLEDNNTALMKRFKIHISSVLGMMAINQQETSQDIAQATREDGSSMKTVAVMTMIFLPATAVSAVMAIPMFDWDATTGGKIANANIWVFFAVAIPLTIVTLLSFQYWIRRRDDEFMASTNRHRRNRNPAKNTKLQSVLAKLPKFPQLRKPKTLLPCFNRPHKKR